MLVGLQKFFFCRNVRELVGGGELEGRSLWGVARSLLNAQEQQRFLLLTHVSTDLGRSRAWIRSVLNRGTGRYLPR